jgi:hypothetical protein
VQLISTLACPHCGHRTPETMPTNACRFFYECTRCSAGAPPQTERLLCLLLLWRCPLSTGSRSKGFDLSPILLPSRLDQRAYSPLTLDETPSVPG